MMKPSDVDPPATADEIEWARTQGSLCGCTGRCREGPHFTCSGKTRRQELIDTVLYLRRHPELKAKRANPPPPHKGTMR